ncbi:prepilin-type N-terminal cleavage/methylation domain-containing protein [Candidatus Saccharibacteria bacterium]|nr:prepilin-type N-terminal cleavage/methylation domain-containing protein [Candidatus Saccharibacteria bacterium]
MLTRLRSQAGDTLIEVLFAFSVLSLVIIGALTIMNQGSVAAQRSLETTLVRNEIDSQATAIRFLHDAYVAQFKPNTSYDPATPAGQWSLMSRAIGGITSASSFGGAIKSCPKPPSGSFIIDPGSAKYIPGLTNIFTSPATTAMVTYDPNTGLLKQAQGIWIEAIRSPTETDVNKKNTRFIDFHIYACWDGPGQGLPMTVGTIVRLYEPES